MIKVNGCEVEFQKFPNGETNLIHDVILSVIEEGNDDPKSIELTLKYESDADLIKLMFVKKYLDTYTGAFISLNIQYMMYSRMDRSENNSPFTLQYITEFINDLQFDSIIVNEPHSDVTDFLLDVSQDKFITPILAKKVMETMDFDQDDSIMFPDKGAESRYKDLISAEHIIVGEKKRDFKTGRITDLKLVGDLQGGGYRVLICDDLTSYGGTFIRSAKELRKLGFDWVGLVVTHAENVIFDGELFDHIDMLFTTDSILNPDTEQVKKAIENNKLKVYSMQEF